MYVLFCRLLSTFVLSKMTTNSDHRLTFSQLTTCTFLSGTVSRTLTAPFDVLKITKQIGLLESRGSLLDLSIFLKRRDGIRGFWKGNIIGCTKILPYSLLHYVVYQQLKWELSDELGRMSVLKRLVTGIAAGITATVTVYPMDLVKTRIIVQPYNKKLSAYNGYIDAFLKIIKNEGKSSLYKGLSITILGCLPYAISTFVAYEVLDQIWKHPKYRITPLEVMSQGCLASAVAMTTTFPIDVVRRKMQAQSKVLPNNGGVDIKFCGSLECFQVIVQQQGLRGLWRGITPALLRVLPYHAIMFLTFDLCKSVCLFYNGYTSYLFGDDTQELDQNIDMDELQEIADYDIELPMDVDQQE